MNREKVCFHLFPTREKSEIELKNGRHQRYRIKSLDDTIYMRVDVVYDGLRKLAMIATSNF